MNIEQVVKLESQQVSLRMPVENETQRILRLALERLGPNGEHWAKWVDYCEDGRYCAIGAVDPTGALHASGSALEKLLEAAAGPEVWDLPEWNDAPDRTFPEVRAMFLRAIELAGGES